MKKLLFALTAFSSVAFQPQAIAQECSTELIKKWGEWDSDSNPGLKPGEGQLVRAAKQCSKARLEAYLAEVKEAVPDKAGLQRLNQLKYSYGKLDLRWQDKNILYQAIGEKLVELEEKFIDYKCQPVIADIHVPADLADAKLVSRDPTLSLNRFLCAAMVHTGSVKIGSPSNSSPDTYKVSFSGAYIKFRVHRPSPYLKDAKKSVGVEAIGNEKGEEPADEALLHYLYGQFGASMTQFLKQ
jgi:hypothetical protein